MINKVTLIGRVGKVPEIKVFDNGTKAASFSLATTEKYTDKSGEKKELTEWHNVVIYGKIADVVEQYVKKGNLLYVEGKLKTRSWDDKDGNKKYITEIIGSTMQMLSGKNSSEGSSTIPAPTENDLPENDLPF